MHTIEEKFSQWSIDNADESTQKLARFMFFVGAHSVLENVASAMKADDGGRMFSDGFESMLDETNKELLPHFKTAEFERVQ